MKRKRIGKQQRELLDMLGLLGQLDLDKLDRNGRRGALSLVRQGLADYGTYSDVPEDGEGEYPTPDFIKLS